MFERPSSQVIVHGVLMREPKTILRLLLPMLANGCLKFTMHLDNLVKHFGMGSLEL